MSIFEENFIPVMGMHRSGTSCMGGILSQIGCYTGIPENQLPADSNNPLGYFEDSKIVQLNDEILSQETSNFFQQYPILNQLCDNINPDNFAWVLGAWSNQIDNKNNFDQNKIEPILLHYLSGHTKKQPCVIKDPRMSITYKIWSKYLNTKAAILMIRNPENVAISLYKRDFLSFETSYDMWHLYMTAALNSLKNIPFLIVDYDHLINETKITVEQIISFLLKNGLNIDTSKKKEAINSVKSELYRSKITSSNIQHPEIYSIYQELLIENTIGKKSSGNYSQRRIRDRLKNAVYSCHASNAAQKLTALKTLNKEIENEALYRFNRINNHPISGPFLKMLRSLKSDPEFGTIEKFFREK